MHRFTKAGVTRVHAGRARTLDDTLLLDHVCRLIVPRLAECCVVVAHGLDGEGSVAAAHVDREVGEQLAELVSADPGVDAVGTLRELGLPTVIHAPLGVDGVELGELVVGATSQAAVPWIVDAISHIAALTAHALHAAVAARDAGDGLPGSGCEARDPPPLAARLCDPVDLVARAVLASAELAHGRDAVIEPRLDDGLPMLVCDEDRVLAVLRAVIDRALRGAPAGGAVRIAARYDCASVVFSVERAGERMPAHALRRLFADERPGAPEGELAAARFAVEAHGGEMWAETPEGSGLRLFFTLPARLATHDIGLA